MASQTPKSASTRLLTMKFMQRAVAGASSPTTPKSEDSHSAKRRKISSGDSLDSPGTPGFVTSLDQTAAKAALEEEERKLQIALEKQAEALGDSRWVLDTNKLPRHDQQISTPLNIVEVGFAQVDLLHSGDERRTQKPKIMKFGSKRGVKRERERDSSSDSDSADSDSDEDSDGEDSPDKNLRTSHGPPKGPRPEIKSRKSVEKAMAQQFAGQRRKKEIQLNKLTSISGSGSGGGGRSSSFKANVQCHRCGEKGHMKNECPLAN